MEGYPESGRGPGVKGHSQFERLGESFKAKTSKDAMERKAFQAKVERHGRTDFFTTYYLV